MRRRKLSDYGLTDYVRTDAPGEHVAAFRRHFGHDPCPRRTYEYRHAHGLRERLPFDMLDDVAPWEVERPVGRSGVERDEPVTRVESLFPVMRDFPAVIQTSKEAQAAIARSAIGPPASPTTTALGCPSPATRLGATTPLPQRELDTDPTLFRVPPPVDPPPVTIRVPFTTAAPTGLLPLS